MVLVLTAKQQFSQLGRDDAGFMDAASIQKVSSSISLLPCPSQTFAHTIPC